jgi:hypothetical protein
MPFQPRSLLAALIMLTAAATARAEILFTATLTHNQETAQGTFLTNTGAPRLASFGNAPSSLATMKRR